MGKRKKIDGVLLLDKPAGISSNQALQQARWLYQAEKAGHGGTLDPFATGLLPVLFGEASKFGRYFLDGDGARFFVRCSKGTYIRSLLRDMAAALGSAGHTHALRRVAVAGLTAMTPLATLRAWQEAGDMAALQALLLPLDCCVAHLPRVVVPPEKLRFIRNGNDIACAAPHGEVALYDGARFFGVGEARDGRVFPQRLCALPPA